MQVVGQSEKMVDEVCVCAMVRGGGRRRKMKNEKLETNETSLETKTLTVILRTPSFREAESNTSISPLHIPLLSTIKSNLD